MLLHKSPMPAHAVRRAHIKVCQLVVADAEAERKLQETLDTRLAQLKCPHLL